MDAVVLTAKQAAVVEILRETGAKMFASEIADARPGSFERGAKSVSPLMTHLVKRGIVEKDKAEVQAVDTEGNAVTKELTRYWLSADLEDVDFSIKAE